jgi:hypothetical protein
MDFAKGPGLIKGRPNNVITKSSTATPTPTIITMVMVFSSSTSPGSVYIGQHVAAFLHHAQRTSLISVHPNPKQQWQGGHKAHLAFGLHTSCFTHIVKD